MRQRPYNFQKRYVKKHQNSFNQLVHLLSKMEKDVADKARQYHKNPGPKAQNKLLHLIGSYAADFCKYSHYYRPVLFTYPLKDQVYKYKWMRESLAINAAPDKHTKSVLEKDYRTLPGDSAIVFYTGNSALNNGSMIFMHAISAPEFITAVTSALKELEADNFY